MVTERDPAKRPHHRDHLGVPLVFAIGDSDPIDRISKDSPHCEAGRLGNPIDVMVKLLGTINWQF